MKQVLLTILTIVALNAHAQYFSFDFTGYKTKLDAVGWGLDFNGGIHLTKCDKTKGNLMAGIGSGIHMLDGSPSKVYVPVYGQLVYYNAKNTINPYINARVGHAFYNGGSKFIGKEQEVKGGLYANVRIGVGIRGYKGFSAIPFVGSSFMRFRYKHDGANAIYDKALFNAGLSFFFL